MRLVSTVVTEPSLRNFSRLSSAYLEFRVAVTVKVKARVVEAKAKAKVKVKDKDKVTLI